MSDPTSQWVSLSSCELSVEVDPLGAQLSALRDRAGRDLLWNGDPSIWAGRAPLLFPIVGELAGGSYRVAAKSYSLPRHGFARGRRFELVEANSLTALFRLAADETTLQIYPFHFELTVRFEVCASTLLITAGVRNLGDAAMPASFGYHPAFRWPLPYGRARAAHYIEFAADEPDPMRRLDARGLLTAKPHPTPITERRLPLADALFQKDVMIFDEIRSRFVTYGADAGPRLRIGYPNSSYLGVWSKPGAPFVCIEPWRGIADPEDFAGNFETKPGVFLVAPGATVPIDMSISLLEA